MHPISVSAASLLFTLSLGAAQTAQADTLEVEDYTITVNNGSVCHAINHGEADFLQRRATALINLAADQDIWVVCAYDSTWEASMEYRDGILESDFSPDTVGMTVLVNLSNTHDASLGGNCVYREVNGAGDVVRTLVAPFSMDAGGATTVEFGTGTERLFVVSPFNAVTVACQLPRNSRINRLIQAPYQYGSGEGDDYDDVYFDDSDTEGDFLEDESDDYDDDSSYTS